MLGAPAKDISGSGFGSSDSPFSMQGKDSAYVKTLIGSAGLFSAATADGTASQAKYPSDSTTFPSTKGQNRVSRYLSERDRQTGLIDILEHICFSTPFDKYSPEELRLGDYARGDSRTQQLSDDIKVHDSL
ncbi:hypothetical protein BDW75DRAFT_225476 [Aspergillus navahoensis]